MKPVLLIAFLTFSITHAVQAQHEQHMPGTDTTQPMTAMPAQDTMPENHAMHHNMDHNMQGNEGMNMSMSHAFSRNLPMTRNGSGTAWLPDNSPMFGYMFHASNWMFMLHGDVYLRYNKQDLFNNGSRGGAKWDAPNMIMLMGQRNVGKKGLFHFNTMLSLDPLTVGEAGYPLLFQTGESYKGQPLIDKQHPHDLFSELSVSYAHAFSKKFDAFAYIAYPGEPALGPTAYVHRPSGFFNPDAPLTHHWVDATHVTFGVATLGVRYGDWKLEGSSFTGREPNEDRYNFDKPRFDSWSGRLSYNPSAKWATQVSHGFIKSPEDLHRWENVHRTTASVTYSARGTGEQFSNITALWGLNKSNGHDGENGVLVEGSHYKNRTVFYGRYEWVQKSGEELQIPDSFDSFSEDLFPIHALTAGASYDLFQVRNTKFALGAQASIYRPDSKIRYLYGSTPASGEVYLRIYPRAMGKRSGGTFIPY